MAKGAPLTFSTAQSKRVQLIFGHAVVWLQFVLFNHIDFRLTCASSNGFVILLRARSLANVPSRQPGLDGAHGAIYPRYLVAFSVAIIGTLNWAMPSLQNLPGSGFSFFAIYLLSRGTRPAFIGAALCLVAAIASSGTDSS